MPTHTLTCSQLEGRRVWLSLSIPHEPKSCAWVNELVDAAAAANTVIDITSQPGLWGAFLPEESKVMAIGEAEIEKSIDETHAQNLIECDLIELLSAIRRESMDLYVLRVRNGINERQMDGALNACKLLKQSGVARAIGLHSHDLATLKSFLNQSDLVDIILAPDNPLESCHELHALALEKQLDVVTCRPLNWGRGAPFMLLDDGLELLGQQVIAAHASRGAVLVGVRTPREIESALLAEDLEVAFDLRKQLEPWIQAYQDEGSWIGLADDPRPWVKAAANSGVTHV